MFKKLIIPGLIIIIAIIAISAFLYRYQILQYTAEKLIRKYLPSYARIDTIKFDFRKGEARIGGFKIINPPGFSDEYLLEIGKITCHYRLRGKALADGFEIADPVLSNIVLNIERLGDGRLNLAAMETVLEKGAQGAPSPASALPAAGKPRAIQPRANTGSKILASVVKLPEVFTIRSGKVVFVDRFMPSRPNVITFENIEAKLSLKLDENYSRVLIVSSTGEGGVNGDRQQLVSWAINWNPTTPRLTMANNFEVSGVDILPFRPYYDRYSPFVFKTGRFSGTLIFDFDNGNIGSSNEVRLSDLKFSVKPGYENSQFWETNVPDLVKYFSSPHGEIVFDFKIKGDMDKPNFYLGPKSKAALVSMAVDKISAAIQKAQGSGDGAGGPKTDLDKAKEYIDLFKGLMKK